MKITAATAKNPCARLKTKRFLLSSVRLNFRPNEYIGQGQKLICISTLKTAKYRKARNLAKKTAKHLKDIGLQQHPCHVRRSKKIFFTYFFIKSASDEIKKDKEKQIKTRANHFQKIYSKDNNISEQVIQNVQLIPIMIKLDTNRTIKELNRAINFMVCEKVLGKHAIILRK